MKSIAIKALAAVSLAVAATAPAAAQEVAVYFGDLDITTAAGAEALNARMLNAVDTVCERPEVRDIKANLAWNACKDAAMSSALEQLAVKSARVPSVTVG